ncbi:MAG TPA: succinate dehydrogenase, cytochrome b556 subunit [Rhizomicrobium sp.]|jgi:succinate dehydrogenase / fumarate reductase cytochrome b subunit
MTDQAHGAARQRPRSPFLIYRWPVTMATSITHRVTGVGLAAGTLLIAWWLVAVMMGPEVYGPFSTFAASIFGQVILFGFVLALAYHFCNGIRHLAWDLGYGFNIRTAHWTGILVYTLALVIAVALFAWVYLEKGVRPL